MGSKRTVLVALKLAGSGLALVVLVAAAAVLAFPAALLSRVGSNAATERLVTGILVTGTASNPVLYVTSSDPRIGSDTRRNRELDTNSGIVSRLTWTGSSWARSDLVRGLPRSRLDHASNGLALDAASGTLFVAQGGNTNRGAPSESFGHLRETSLTGTVLAIDLEQLGDEPYDLPTVRGGAPFGGRGGSNRTVAPPAGPVRVIATGLRNPYDLVLTRTKRLYATDNGANAKYGDRPDAGCTHAPREGGSRGQDKLVRIVPGGFYGHPNPARGQCGPPSQRSLGNFAASTNGIAEMRTTSLAGDLLTVSLDGTLHRLRLGGNDRILAHERVLLPGFPLDVAVQGEDDPLPGTIWSALYVDARGNPGGISVLEPQDLGRSGAWITLAGGGAPRQEVSYVSLGNRLYLAGGGTLHQAFDLGTGSWTELAPFPERLDHIQGVALGDRIYYVGGLRSWPDDEVGTVRVYDPARDVFSEAPPMRRPRGAGGVVAYGGKLYYVGGLHGGRAVPWLDVFDPATGTWNELPDMPRARDHFQAAVVGGRLIVTGGREREIGTEYRQTDAYDLGTNRWTIGLAPLPTPRGGFGAAVVGDELIVIGGEVPGRALTTVEAYDAARDSWRRLPSMPTPRHGIQAAACGDQIFVAGGGVQVGGGGTVDTHELLTLGPRRCLVTPAVGPGRIATLAGGFVLSSLVGASSVSPTSLQIGPDGRLYVAQQNGSIFAYTIRRRAAGAYEVVATEEIDLIRRLQNHDDDGSSATDLASLMTVLRDKVGQ